MDLHERSEVDVLPATSVSEQQVAGPSISLRSPPDTRSVVLGSLGIYVCSRLVGLFAALGSTWIEPSHRLSSILTSWDGYWYLKIAAHGYPATVASEGAGNRWAFFPGYPAAIRALERITPLSYRDSAILISLVFGALAAVGVGLLVLDIFTKRAALQAVALVAFFPTAFVMSMAYTESLFLALAAFGLLAIQRRWWLAAAILTNLASLTRSIGIVLAAAITIEACKPGPWRDRVRILGAAALSSLAFVAWCFYGDIRTGHLLAFQSAEKAWGGGGFVWFANPFRSLGRLLTGTSSWHVASDVTAGIAVVVVLAGFACLLALQLGGRRLPTSWWVYAVGGTLTAFSPFWTTSTLRYIMVIVPFFGAIAFLLRRLAFGVVLGSFALFQGVLAIVVFVGAFSGHSPTAP